MTSEAHQQTEITGEAELRELLGEPVQRALDKERSALADVDREWLAAAPFCLVATADADGACDVSPKGDPAGKLALVLDDTTIAIPDRPGNRRADGYRNILSNPHVGLIFLIPGRGDTLRINGRARLVKDAPFFDGLAVKGRRPRLAMVVDIDTVFHHCSKAFLRSELWRPETWGRDAVPSRPRIAKRLESPDVPLEALEEYYGPSYAERLY
ncbi:pyridoxamine 5'-phosphate oxidase family protein [Nocardiopsis potens]|uniref:pyridoxamine 5'-phosphate oxidase family protein n=1 Tax=Nocardiopsis potens TaxID=1246458 RepID=UPI0003465703|nr:pyridoxamine 5'-phosphate oxidase family protein [Nocardiopsis potens]